MLIEICEGATAANDAAGLVVQANGTALIGVVAFHGDAKTDKRAMGGGNLKLLVS